MMELGQAGPLFVFAAFALAALAALRGAAAAASGRIGCIDGIRGYLALSVLVHHFLCNWKYRVTGEWGPPVSVFYSCLGSVPVQMFFMITGLLFYGQIARTGPGLDWRRLYVGRVFRIVPLYLLAVAVMAATVFARQGLPLLEAPGAVAAELGQWLAFTLADDPDIDGYGSTRLILAGVVWTLRYEWLFYAALPLLAAVVWRIGGGAGRRVALLVAGLAVLLVFRHVRVGGFRLGLLTSFVYGMLAWEIANRPALAARLMGRAGSSLFWVALGLALTLFGYLYGQLRIFLVFVAFVPVAAGASGFGVLAWRASRVLGDASYSIYLLHGFVLYALFDLLARLGWIGPAGPPWLLLPVASAVIALFAMATYRAVEQPSIALGRRLSGR